MEAQLYKLLKRNDAPALEKILSSMPSDNIFTLTIYHCSLIDFIFQYCNWDMIRLVFMYYRKKGIRNIFKHERSICSLWKRGYRSIVYQLIKVGMNYTGVMKLTTTEVDFDCLIHSVPQPHLLIAQYKDFMKEHGLVFEWFKRYETANILSELYNTKIASKS